MRNLAILLFILLPIVSSGQNTVTKNDYKRATSFLWQNLNNKKVFNLAIEPVWFGDSTGFSFFTQSKNGRTYRYYDFKTKKVLPLFDSVRLAKSLSEHLKITIPANELTLAGARKFGINQFQFSFRGKSYIMDLNSYKIALKKEEVFNPMESRSPDGKWIAFSKDYNLYLRSTETGEEKQLSKAGVKNFEYASYYGWSDIMEGEGVDRPNRFAVNWSPDTKWIQTYVCDLRSANKMYLLDWSIDTLYRAKLLSYFRASPGDTNMVHMIPVFFNISTGEELRKDDLRSTHTNPISYGWSDSQPGVVYETNNVRGYQKVEVKTHNLNTKQSELLYSETSNTNIDGFSINILDAGMPVVYILSEKDGWRQLYSVEVTDKSVKPVTKGNYYISNILFANEKKRFVIYSADGKEEGRNPYYNHIYRINLDGTGFTMLTPENANHDAYVSPDGKWLVDNISALDMPTRTVLRDAATGKIVLDISSADITALKAMNTPMPETFTATGRDGRTTIYGAMWKPSNFDPSKKYPVIDQSYTGPHTFSFPRNFGTALSRGNQALAELGFIVVVVDGLGTAARSKAFHNFSYKNMDKNLTCHMLAIKELGKKYAWVDVDRVGIFGHSAGGYDAGHALLEFPDFYKVGVASSADHDFRMEKDWWPEMYMGWPVDSTYHKVSNITMAGNLKGKLLITHGGIDENVNPSATFKLAEALVKANKEFDMLIFPSQRHGYTGNTNEYFLRKRWNYFVEHLLGAKPIWDFSLRGEE